AACLEHPVAALDGAAGAGATAAYVVLGARVAVVTGRRVVRMLTRPASVTLIVRANLAVVGARGAGRHGAVVGRFVAGIVTLGATRARIAGVGRAAAPTAGIGAVAEEAVAARARIVRMTAGARAVALVVRADVAVVGARRACRHGTVVGRLVA